MSSSHASAMKPARWVSSAPRFVLACAAAFLTKASARTSSGMQDRGWPEIGKFSTARAVCTPQ
jgi:hypothetical protein